MIGIAQAKDLEFIANNPSDWMLHCHMVHHMMSHTTRQVGPRLRQNVSVDQYLANIDSRPQVDAIKTDPGFRTPGYPQEMKSMNMSEAMMEKIWSRREVQGMRRMWPMSVMGLMTTLRVLPEDLYRKVMETEEPVEKGSVFEEIVRRFGDPNRYEPGQAKTMTDMKM